MAKAKAPRAEGKHRLETLELMKLSEEDAELAIAIQRWERGFRVDKKRNQPPMCGPRPTLGVLVSCGCRLRKWSEETQTFSWVPVHFRVAQLSVSKRCFICRQRRVPL